MPSVQSIPRREPTARTRNAIRITSANIILQLVTALSGIILPRLLIREYGSSVNGLVVSIKQLLMYFSIVGAGIGVASLAALYKPLAERNPDKINSILSATKGFFRRSGYIFLALLSATVLVYPAVVQSSLSSIQTRILIIVLGGGTLIEYMLLMKYRILLNADQRANITFWYQTQGIALNTILSVVLIKLHCSVLVVQFFATLVYLLRAMMLASRVKRDYEYVNYDVPADYVAISTRWTAFSFKVSEIVITYTPVVIITLACGLLAVSVYSVYNMVFFALNTLVSVFSTGLASTFGNVLAREEDGILQKSFRTYEFLYYGMAFFCYICAMKLILPFVSVYTKGVTDVNYSVPALAYLFVASGLARILRTPSLTLVEAAGRFKDNNKLNIAEAVANVTLSLVLVFRMGMVGVLLASLLTGMLRTIAYIFYANHYILRRNLGRTILSILANMAIVMAFVFVPIRMESASFGGWALLASKVGLLVLVVVFACNTVVDFASLKNVIQRIKYVFAGQAAQWGRCS